MEQTSRMGRGLRVNIQKMRDRWNYDWSVDDTLSIIEFLLYIIRKVGYEKGLSNEIQLRKLNRLMPIWFVNFESVAACTQWNIHRCVPSLDGGSRGNLVRVSKTIQKRWQLGGGCLHLTAVAVHPVMYMLYTRMRREWELFVNVSRYSFKRLSPCATVNSVVLSIHCDEKSSYFESCCLLHTIPIIPSLVESLKSRETSSKNIQSV